MIKRGCSKSPTKMRQRISALTCFSATHVLKAYAPFLGKEDRFSGVQDRLLEKEGRFFCVQDRLLKDCAALNFLVLFIELFEHALKRGVFR
ncbi:hypothetical protein [Gracilibacillus alcaliphilus]|uniref:hypothetical protein n=1 Tax=Gracilibacillus alcaliphilus TaxID=1401441 RepID=UPI00195CDC37|nr:hypothetical protein [Gracilibacillus alcaliphilus]MBM7676430.1 hypothetical protein [Gracilibacillus alcaliphilus]